MIATGGEGEEGENVNLKICLAGEMNLGLQREYFSNLKLHSHLCFHKISPIDLHSFKCRN